METQASSRRVQEFVGCLTALTSILHQSVETDLLRDLAGSAVTLPQLKLMAMMTHRAHWNIHEVAACLHVSDAAASKIVDRLVRHRYLRRVEMPEDRRVAELSLTRRGHHVLHAYYAALAQKLDQLFEALPAEDLEGHEAFIDRLALEIRKGSAQAAQTCCHCGLYRRENCLLRAQAPELCFFAQTPTPGRAKQAN
jgi:DNA-binding MarR family transcriptional regulator